MTDSAYSLVLYVAGASAKSERARANLAAILAAHFDSEAEVEIVDLLEEPHLARDDQIVAVPSLVRRRPGPRTVIVGDLSDAEKVLSGLGAIRA